MRWADITVETTQQAQDAIGNIMFENACGGVALEGEDPILVKCYLPADDRLEERIMRMRQSIRELAGFGIDVGAGEITMKYAEEEDWAESWKQFFHTTRVGKRIVVKPTWEEYTPEPRDIVIEIHPGMAFGTGNHATTRLCLQSLEKYVKRRNVVVDFGTGSGILAIAAAKLGASLVIAFDFDEQAVRAARENVQRNELEEIIEVHQASDPAFIGKEVDIVTANLLAEIVMAEADDLAALLKVGGTLIASGLTRSRAIEVEQSLRNAGFDIADTLTEGEWAAIIGRKAG